MEFIDVLNERKTTFSLAFWLIMFPCHLWTFASILMLVYSLLKKFFFFPTTINYTYTLTLLFKDGNIKCVRIVWRESIKFIHPGKM